MKKHLYLAVCITYMTMTVGAVITSDNIVGYRTMNTAYVENGAHGIPFCHPNGSRNIQGLFFGVDGVDFDENKNFLNTATKMSLITPYSETPFYYLNNGKKIIETNGRIVALAQKGWCDENGYIQDVDYTPGFAIRIKQPGGRKSIYVGGMVPKEGSVSIDYLENYARLTAIEVCNPYPKTVYINGPNKSLFQSGMIPGWISDDESNDIKGNPPQVVIYKFGTFESDNYYYVSNKWELVGGEWKLVPGEGWIDWENQDMDDSYAIQPGCAFWLYRGWLPSSYRITIVK